jgi:hypothetical protein
LVASAAKLEEEIRVARVPLVDVNDPNADPEAVALLRGLEDAGHEILNVHRAMANHPELMGKLFDMAGSAYYGGSLNEQQRELPYLTSAIATECFY